MTTYYVSDQGSNTSPYDTMLKAANSKATVDALLSDTDTVFYASDHTEPISASFTIYGGSQGSPVTYLSVNRTTEVYESMADGGGFIGDLGGAYDCLFDSWLLLKGFVIRVGDDIFDAGGGNGVVIEDTQININDGFEYVTSHTGSLELRDVNYIQETSGRFLVPRSDIKWIGGTYSWGGSGAVSSPLFRTSEFDEGMTLYVEAVDFQDLDAGDYLIDKPKERAQIMFVGCKVPAELAGFMGATITERAAWAKFHNISSEDTLIAIAEYSYQGLCTDETAIYTGASETSIEMAALATVVPGLDGLKFDLFHGYSTANPTFEVEINADEATALTDNDIWLDIFGPDDTTGALSLITSTKASDIMNPTTLTSSSASWTGTGGFTNEQKRKITKALTGYQAGQYKIVVNVAKNITAYVDFDVTVS